jgi:poly-beta-1,6-N-acetyl-D-glucosamine synthase
VSADLNSISPSSEPAQDRQVEPGGYLLITPVRNEEEFLQQTINSVASQTLCPVEWIIVDDGSSDGTWRIMLEAASQHNWIKPFRRADRGFRHSGAGVVEAFYDGYHAITRPDWQFLVKLDGDLSFNSAYFADCLMQFERDPKLGIGGGLICAWVNGELAPESRFDPKFHVRGATKIYRRACWEAIGGLVRSPGWDGMDEIKANMLGWRTATFPDLKVRHFRPAGLAYGRWKDWVKGGRGNYITGYHPLFMLAKSIRRLGIKPYGLASLGLLTGYFSGYVRRIPRVADPATINYIRQQQINRLLGRKSIWSE